MRVSDQGYLAFVAILFGILVCLRHFGHLKFFKGHETSDQGYLALVDRLFGILKA
jgi:hypothetical protein